MLTNERNIMEREIELYEEDQRFCDIADTILKILVERQVCARESLRILEKAKKAIEASVQSASWGLPLICGAAPNEAQVWSVAAVAAEIKRRKDRGAFQDTRVPVSSGSNEPCAVAEFAPKISSCLDQSEVPTDATSRGLSAGILSQTATGCTDRVGNSLENALLQVVRMAVRDELVHAVATGFLPGCFPLMSEHPQ